MLVGLSRTGLAMARCGELPRMLGRVCGRGTPWRADLAGGLVTVAVTVLAGPTAAIAVSACSVLVYYAVINVAALRLPPAPRRWPAWASVLGLLLCLVLAALLPPAQVVITVAVLAVGWTACTVLPRRDGTPRDGLPREGSPPPDPTG